MASTMLAKSSGVELKDGTQRVDQESLRRYDGITMRLEMILTYSKQALEFCEMKQMADKAGLFKYTSSEYYLDTC